jgi:hypothetical protein
MGENADANLETNWIDEHSSEPIGFASTGKVRVREGALVIERWSGGNDPLVVGPELFGNGRYFRLLVLRVSSRPSEVLAVGEEGTELLRLDLGPDLERPLVTRVAEIPRDPNSVGGMCFLTVLSPGPVTLIHWERGVLALDRDLELIWRQDLRWNHEIIHLDEAEIWFDYLYDSENGLERIGVEPYGFFVVTGGQLFDRRPPEGPMAQKPFWGGRPQP